MIDVLGQVWSDISSDGVAFAVILMTTLVGPTVLASVALVRGSRLAWVAPLLLLAQVVIWGLYYALSWSNPGLGGFFALMLIPAGIGLLASVIALGRTFLARVSGAGWKPANAPAGRS